MPTNPATNGGGRLVVDLRRRSDLLDATLVHHDDAVRELERLVLVVRHEQARDPELAVQLVEPVAELLPDACVERAERLVQQEDLRSRRERARERDPLPLSAGELIRVAVAEARELHELEQLLDPRRRSRSFAVLRTDRPNATFCATSCDGTARSAGTRSPTRRSCTVLYVCSSPSIQIRPDVGSSSPAIIRSTVLLPEPLGPRSAVMLPASAVKETSRTASKSPNRFHRCSIRMGVPVI